uniref:Uncharacterized protein n=1 Tax=viral metagenome TaxID=1070528 RepID=A0A6C0CT94_9ZZZZ
MGSFQYKYIYQLYPDHLIDQDKITFSCNNEPLVTNTNTYHSIIWVSIENEYNDLTGGKKVNKRQRKTRKHQKSRKHKKSRKSRK